MTQTELEQAPQHDFGFIPIAAVWIAYGLLIAYLLASGSLTEIGNLAFERFGQFIPAVGRIEKNASIDVMAAKMHASIMLLSMPALVAALLFFKVENAVAGVRRKGKEFVAALIFVALASLVFVAGFNSHIGRNSFIGFAIQSTLMTGLSAYCFRIAFCIAFKK